MNLIDQMEDITARKHGGNAQSDAAFERLKPVLSRRRREVLDAITRRGLEGAVAKEIATELGLELHKVSGRCSELKALGLIADSGRRRDGAAVLVALGVLLGNSGD
jgi:predicted transcriptional regulator